LAANPFRYRGYYYDTESGLYYLNSRYYDPATGRFLNEDTVSYLEPKTLGGLNLYVYCNNNPIMGYDPNGTWDWGLFWNAFTNVVSFGLGVFVGTCVGFATGNVFLGVAVGIETFSVLNNLVNAIYYATSDGVSNLTSTSYSGIECNSMRYISRWERLDYTKQQTGESSYNLNAWRYYSEYSLHMYGWLFTASYYEQNNGKLSGIAGSCVDAYVDPNLWDTRLEVIIGTVIFGMLGV